MPTPIAHTGFALSLALLQDAHLGALTPRARLARAALLVALAADVDFVPGLLTGSAVAFHHGATHSIAFAVLLAGLAALAVGPSRYWLPATLSHPLLDWVTGEPGADVRKYGIEALWPFDSTRYMSDWHAFGAYHIDTLGLVGGVLTWGATANLTREVGFAVACVGVAAVIRRATPIIA